MRLFKLAFYEVVFTLYVLVYLPKWLWDFAVNKKYRKSFLKRLGFKIEKLPEDGLFHIWIHAASVGEAKAAEPLCKELKKAFSDSKIIFSSVTETGYNQVKQTNPYVDKQLYLPLDFFWLSKKLVSAIKPKIFILIESEFWPNLLNQLKKANCPIYLVNGKISEKSYKRYLKLPFLKKFFFDSINHFCVQNALYQKRFEKLGVSNDKISVTGNLKYDIENHTLTTNEKENLKTQLGILKHHQVITIGSTHKGEEKLLLNALQPLLKDRRYKIIIAPRHPERFFELKKLLEEMHIHYLSYSKLRNVDRVEKVIVLDQMGVLNLSYQISDVAIVGGSFVPVGGHNLLEPVKFGVPTIFGLYTSNQSDMKNFLLGNKLGFECDKNNVLNQILSLVGNYQLSIEFKKKSQRLMKELQGAAKKSAQTIKKFSGQRATKT